MSRTTTTEPKPSDAQAIIDAVERMQAPVVSNIAVGRMPPIPAIIGREHGVIEVKSVRDLVDEWRTQPERKTGFAELTTVESFIAHFNRHRSPDASVVFVNEATPELVAVYNYNGEGDKPAQFGDYGARYTFPLSDEWRAWAEVNGRWLSLNEFAEFLENRIADVIDAGALDDEHPIFEFSRRIGVKFATPSRLMELSRGLSVHVKHEVADHKNLGTGEGQIAFRESHSDPQGQALQIPGALALGIPVFRGAAVADVIALRLRYRVRDGKVSWAFTLHQPEAVLRQSIADAADMVEKVTEAPLFWGTPERD